MSVVGAANPYFRRALSLAYVYGGAYGLCPPLVDVAESGSLGYGTLAQRCLYTDQALERAAAGGMVSPAFTVSR